VHVSYLIFVAAADLNHNNSTGQTVIGPETARVCNKAARVYHDHITEEPLVVVTAGFSPKHHVIMGEDIMVPHLKGCAVQDMLFHQAEKFNTDGEIRALVDHVIRIKNTERIFRKLYVVARWWHIPRIAFLLWYRLDETDHPIEMRYVPVGSRDWRGFLREFIAWPVNILRIALEPENTKAQISADHSMQH
jgi:hypothetical protein